MPRLPSHNELQDLPSTVEELDALEWLKADHNAFVCVPAPVVALRGLKLVDLSQCVRCLVSASILVVAELRPVAHASACPCSNALRELTPAIAALEAVVELNLEHNQLARLPEELGGEELCTYYCVLLHPAPHNASSLASKSYARWRCSS